MLMCWRGAGGSACVYIIAEELVTPDRSKKFSGMRRAFVARRASPVPRIGLQSEHEQCPACRHQDDLASVHSE